MESHELVKKTILGQNDTDITPLYGWVFANMEKQITSQFGSVRGFEDAYEFDMAHIFGGPSVFNWDAIQAVRDEEGEVTPEALLSIPWTDPDREADYANIKAELAHQRGARGRFCYMQTPGIFEALNDAFGIEDHLCWLAMYPDEMAEVYRRQAAWNLHFIRNTSDLGIDMVHISDDWGAQNSLMFSPQVWRDMIFPHHRDMVAEAHKCGKLASLHSDGNINSVLDGIVEIGYNMIHPYQETAGMSYDTYLKQYADSFGILGGLCIQSTLGFGDYARLEGEIRRVFNLLKGKRWVFCTTHFVQDHCSLEELVFAYDTALKLSGKKS